MKRLIFLTFLLLMGGWRAQAQVQKNGAITAGGTDCSTATRCVVDNLPGGTGSIGISLSGTFSGTFQFEVSSDGTNWVSPVGGCSPGGTGSAVTSATGAGTWNCPTPGMIAFRVRCSSYSSGQANVNIQTSPVASLGGGGGVPSSQVQPNGGAVYLSQNCGTQANCTTLPETGNFNCLPTTNASSTTVTTPAGSTPFPTDISSFYVYVTNYSCSGAGAGATQISATLQTGVTYVNPNQITLATAAAGTCAPGSLACTVVWGKIATTAFNTAWLAVNANCGKLIIDAGLWIVEAPIEETTYTDCGYQADYSNNAPTGVGVSGQGRVATIIATDQNFNWTNCSANSTTDCFFSNTYGGGKDVDNLSINGFDSTGYTALSQVILYGGPNSRINNVGIYGFIGAYFNNFSLLLSSDSNWYTSATGIQAVSGGTPCGFEGANIYISDSLCAGGGLGAYFAGDVYSNHVNYSYGNTAGGNGIFPITTGNILYSTDDYFLSIEALPSGYPAFDLGTGAQLHMKGDTVVVSGALSGSYGIRGGSAYLQDTTFSIGSGTLFDATTYYDGCNNIFSAGVLAASTTVYGSCSVTGAQLGNTGVALTSGWGAGTAVSAAAGDSHSMVYTITLAGTSTTGAVATVTFPTPFIVAPRNCWVTNTKGTDAPSLTSVVVGTPSATTVTLTYNGTLTATDTIIQGLACQ